MRKGIFIYVSLLWSSQKDNQIEIEVSSLTRNLFAWIVSNPRMIMWGLIRSRGVSSGPYAFLLLAPITPRKSSYMLLTIYKGSQKISTGVFLKSHLGESGGEFACASACTEMIPLFRLLGMSQIQILPFLTSHFLLLNCPYSYLNCFFLPCD